MHDAIIDCARSIAEGYGAGSLSDKEEDEFLGFWTSRPDETTKYSLVIDIPEDLQDESYLVAGIVRRKAKEFQS